VQLEQDDVDARFRAIVERLEAAPLPARPAYHRSWPSAGEWLRAVSLLAIAPAGVWILIAMALLLGD
jgi:hypothetical protein